MNYNESRKFIFESENPRKIFCAAMMETMQDNEKFESILNASCDDGCSFSRIFEKLAFMMFIIMQVNVVKISNDFVHMKRKRNYSNNSSMRPQLARKAAKLQSQ